MSKKSGYIVVGVDEAGRGAWAGPVAAAAFAFSEKGKPRFKKKLADSKTIAENAREKLYEEMMSDSNRLEFFGAVSLQENTVIDTVGIREANRLAMEAAILQVLAQLPAGSKTKIQIDGRDNYRFDFGIFSDMVEEVEYIVRGDSKIREIMAASILAKVSRDRVMREISEKYPEYCFAKHKWYGTKIHQESLQEYGACPLHRTSYEPVRLRILQDATTPSE